MGKADMRLERGWERWFGMASLERGLDYYGSGFVDMEEVAGGWRGHADGSERYDVFLAVDEDGVLSPASEGTYCSCPHALDGNFCKHVAAACYLVDDEIRRREALPEGDAAAEADAGEDSHDVLDRLDEATKMAFLGEIIDTDEIWRRELLGRYGRPDAGRVCHELSRDIRSAVRAHSYRGFIEWRDALSFEHEVLAAIDRAARPLINRAQVKEAIQVSLAALDELRYIEIDDSNGFFGSAIDACFEIWKDVLEVDGGDAAKDLVLDAALDLLDEEEWVGEAEDILEFAQGAAEALIIERFAGDAHTAERMLAVARERISEPMADVSAYDAFSQRRSAKWVLASLRSLAALRHTSAERRDFARPYIGNQAVRQALVDDALENGERAVARRLLEEGEAQLERVIGEASRDSAWRVTHLKRNLNLLSEQLLAMLEEDGDEGAIADQLRKVLAVDDQPASVCERASRLHELVGDDAWETERERVLEAAMSGAIRRELLAQDGLVERLMDDIERTGSVYDLMSYEDILKGRYAAQILEAYRQKLETDLKHASSRKAYQSGVAILSRFDNIDGGAAARDAACAWIRRTYPRKRALQDELDKRIRTWM